MARKKSDKPKLSWRLQQFIKNPRASHTRIRHICEQEKLTEEFMDEYSKYLDWYLLSRYQDMSEKFIEKHLNEVKWNSILSRNMISEGFIRKYADDLNWTALTGSAMKFSTNFIREFEDKIDFNRFFYQREVGQKVVEEFINKDREKKINWNSIIRNNALSVSFIRLHLCQMEKGTWHFWNTISEHQKLDENFLIEFKDKIDWRMASRTQVITEKIMEKCADKLNWNALIKHDITLTEEILEKYEKYFDWSTWSIIIQYQNVSEEFLEKRMMKIPWEHLVMLHDCGVINHKIDREFLERMRILKEEENKKNNKYF